MRSKRWRRPARSRASRSSSPGVSENAPNQGTTGGSVGQVVINGAFAFDNVFMINGVDINDNLFAQPQNLFIEDAIEETQVLTSGISAEFGRFSGGVVNAITRSGGNVFSGSGRVNFSNPAWTTETPFEVTRGTEHIDQTSRVYEGTFGGPLVRDRLWFFTSGRYGKGSNQVTLAQTGIGLTSVDTNKRGEIKITGTVAQGHTIQSGYLNSPRTQNQQLGASELHHRSAQRGRSRQPELVLLRELSRGAEEQSARRGAVFGAAISLRPAMGERARDILESPFLSVQQCQCLYNAPYFDATDPEHRNNRQLTGSVTDYWNLAGRHETKGGYEWFRSQRTGGNSQSSTSYVFNADFRDRCGRPAGARFERAG